MQFPSVVFQAPQFHSVSIFNKHNIKQKVAGIHKLKVEAIEMVTELQRKLSDWKRSETMTYSSSG